MFFNSSRNSQILLTFYSILFFLIILHAVLVTAAATSALGNGPYIDISDESSSKMRVDHGNSTHKHSTGRSSKKHAIRQELLKINFIIDELFTRSRFSAECKSDEAAKLMARDCMMGLAFGLRLSSIYDCRYFQGEYDCVAAALRGCFKRAVILSRFYRIQTQMGKMYGCHVIHEVDPENDIIPNPAQDNNDQQHNGTGTLTKSNLTSLYKSDNSANDFGQRSSLRILQLATPKLNNEKNTNYLTSSKSSSCEVDALGDVARSASFLFIWLRL